MIEFNSIHDFEIPNVASIINWLETIIKNEEKHIGEINYVFCDDNYLHKMNVKFLNHDTLTDVISFDYTQENVISGDVYISTERVADNALDFNVAFIDELHRVIVHGLLHYCGYKDKTDDDARLMRSKEDLYLSQR